jgi:uncharacterized membrane protein
METLAMSQSLEYTHAALPPARSVVPSGFVPVAAARPRLDSIDLLRGLIMIVMALDHTRDFFGGTGLNPRDVADPALFMTRWVTHFCAPIFIFLSGISAWLYGTRGRSTGEVSRFLLTRGLWLIFAELTIVRLGWSLGFDLSLFVFQVIFAIGASMVVLAGLVYLPRWAIATIGIAMIAGHNLLDGIKADDLGAFGWAWHVLHQSGMLQFGSRVRVFVLYPLIPWIGVMAVGYALGPVFQRERRARLQWLLALGAAVTLGFIVIRATNLYGDPTPWAVQDGALATVLSFINCEKYPPSLLYLMMTLGPALFLLAAFEGARGRVADFINTYGRVPFFYYVAHIYLIHAFAVVGALLAPGDAAWLLGALPHQKPPGYGLSLAGIYTIWLVVIVTLYPFCAWFAALKQRRRAWWLSYL